MWEAGGRAATGALPPLTRAWDSAASVLQDDQAGQAQLPPSAPVSHSAACADCCRPPYDRLPVLTVTWRRVCLLRQAALGWERRSALGNLQTPNSRLCAAELKDLAVGCGQHAG